MVPIKVAMEKIIHAKLVRSTFWYDLIARMDIATTQNNVYISNTEATSRKLQIGALKATSEKICSERKYDLELLSLMTIGCLNTLQSFNVSLDDYM